MIQSHSFTLMRHRNTLIYRSKTRNAWKVLSNPYYFGWKCGKVSLTSVKLLIFSSFPDCVLNFFFSDFLFYSMAILLVSTLFSLIMGNPGRSWICACNFSINHFCSIFLHFKLFDVFLFLAFNHAFPTFFPVCSKDVCVINFVKALCKCSDSSSNSLCIYFNKKRKFFFSRGAKTVSSNLGYKFCACTIFAQNICCHFEICFPVLLISLLQ